MKQQTLKQTKTTNSVVTKPAVDPAKKRDEILDSVAEDCLIQSESYVEQSKAPEGE